jgi:hypothetical protein
VAKSKEVTVASQTALAERPSYLGEESRGSEEVTIQDITIPRLSMVQDLSPQRKKNNAEYIEGCEEGMTFNTVTNELYADPVIFVPVYFRLEWLVWKHRDAGGGLQGVCATQEEAVALVAAHPLAGQLTEKQEPVLEVQDTAQHFGLLLDPNSPAEDPRATEIVVSMSKSQLKPSRQLNSQVRIAGGDRFERYYRLSAVQVDGARGEYYNWKVEQLGFVAEKVFAQAEALYESVVSGKRDVERDDATSEEEADDSNM